jgi:hypothetical protein
MMTYDKLVVLAVANKTAQAMRAEREEKLAAWDAQSLLTRFWLSVFAVVRPSYHGERRQEIAERVSFKATFCTEETVELSDDEIDAIREWWLIEETLA